MDRGEQLRRIAEHAADQWGLVTAAQAKRVGLSAVQILRLAEAGLIENVGRGVYLLQAAGFPLHLEIKVAWLRLQPAAFASERPLGGRDSGVVSHASACQLHGLGDIPAPSAEISVPRRRTTTEPFVHLRTVQLERDDITLVQGLPVTTARRTILDLLRTKADGGHLGGVIADAERLDLIEIQDLQEAAQPFARNYGLPAQAAGQDLIEHLVDQASRHLRSQEVARAGREGFATALELMTRDDYEPSPDLRQSIQALQRMNEQMALPSSALQETVRRLGEQLAATNAPLQEAMRRMHEQAVLPNSAVRQLGEQLAATNAPLQEAMRRMNEQMALPNSALQETVRRIGELAARNAPLQEVRRLRQQTANPRALESGSRAATARSRPAVEQQDSSSGRAAHETSADQSAQIHGADDVRKDTGRKPDPGYDH
ncbi:type IV toxin-antitoxin system AbiEi family antitoxin domain-containing protein [Streptomyces sp. HB132]|uniref:type IV toxin-antitoxin system AbiEi family antitoxin domain-containing protein n=1 Tax=Streptomyces sp. HB132 TaxID=767388 RepID=UPI001960E02E|nr:type IV toxin-antitoxin system AbiEi family antitoxin domain-containing protein [Streptomyces sp. HB132]MBM7437300.1 putative transcriptional regulator of viral defense system [Streptomyces sp. HB132]